MSLFAAQGCVNPNGEFARRVSLCVALAPRSWAPSFPVWSEVGMDPGAYWGYLVPPEVMGRRTIGGTPPGERVLGWIGVVLQMRHDVGLLSGQDCEGWGARGG